MYPQTDAETDADVERGETTDLDDEWLTSLASLDLKLVPVIYRGTEHLYRRIAAVCDCGLMGTCLPRAVHLRAGVGRPVDMSTTHLGTAVSEAHAALGELIK